MGEGGCNQYGTVQSCQPLIAAFFDALCLIAAFVDALLLLGFFDAAGATSVFRFTGVMIVLFPSQAAWKSFAETAWVGWSPSQKR